MTPTLEQVIADYRGDLAVLRKHAETVRVDLIEQILDAVKESAADYLTFISEDDARLRSGHTVEWLRARFAQWARDGHAKIERRQRWYRAVVVERRADVAAAREAGRIAGRRGAA
jgi:hypothetical protein